MSTFTSVTDNHSVFLSKDGLTLSYGRLDFFEIDGTTPKAVYSDISRTISLGVSITLTANGRTPVQAFCGTGVTMCRVYQYTGTGVGEELPADPVWVLDNQFYLSGVVASTGSSSEIIAVPTLSALKDLAVGGTVLLTGYYTEGDKPAIAYTWNNTSLVSDNAGNYVKSNTQAGGAWIYVPDGDLDAVHFGVGLGTNDHSGRLFTWANELSYSGRDGVISSGIVRFNDNVGVTFILSPKITVGAGVKWLNMGVGTARVYFTHYQTKLLSENAFMHASSVGQIYPYFGAKREQDVDLRWFGVLSPDGYQAMFKAIDACGNGINTLRIVDPCVITTPLADKTLPPIRCVGGGFLYLDWNTTGTVKFGGVAEGHNGEINDIYGNLIYDETLTPVVRTSWLKATKLNFISASNIILDSNTFLDGDITIPNMYLENGKVTRSSGTLTITNLIGDGRFWESTTPLSLKVFNRPYQPNWYINGQAGQMFADCTQSGMEGVADCTNRGQMTFTGGIVANLNGRNLTIRNLEISSSIYLDFTDCNILTIEDCKITSSRTNGPFLVQEPADSLEIRRSRILLAGYTSGSVYGRFSPISPTTFSPLGGVTVIDSEMFGAVLFQGSCGGDITFSNSSFSGYMNFASEGNFLSSNCKYSNTGTYSHPSGSLRLASGQGLQFNGGFVKGGELYIYGRTNPITSLATITATINGVEFIAVGASYPNVKFSTTLTDTIANIVSTGCTFLGNTTNPSAVIPTYEFPNLGVDFIGATCNISGNISYGLYYAKRETRGRELDVRTVSAVDLVPASEEWTFSGVAYTITPSSMITISGAFRNLRAVASANVLLASDNSNLVGGVNVRSVNNTTGAITVCPYAWTSPTDIKPTITLDWTEYDQL